MTYRMFDICVTCVYFKSGDENPGSEKPTCLAYPEGIPENIRNGEPHHLELLGDEVNKVTYEPFSPEEGEMAKTRIAAKADYDDFV